jgi:hypothetical protein
LYALNKGGGALRLPRFNMPFEAGMAYVMHASMDASNTHELLVLEAKAYRYQASISDLAGLDPKAHHNDPLKAIAAVRSFLAQHNPGKSFSAAPHVQRRYVAFSKQLPQRAKSMKLSARLLRSWDYALDLQNLMAGWIRDNP